MTPAATELRRELAKNPTDPQLWRVLADALLAAGDVRGELIALGLNPAPPHEAAQRARAGWQRQRDDVLSSEAPPAGTQRWSMGWKHGFVDALSCRPQFLPEHESWLALQPLRRLALADTWSGDLSALETSSALARIERLEIDVSWAETPADQLLRVLERAANLRELSFCAQGDLPPPWEVLERWSGRNRLRALEFSSATVDAARTRWLCRAFPALERLYAWHAFDSEALRVLGSDARFELKSLVLGNLNAADRAVRGREVDEAVLVELLRAPACRKLERLALSVTTSKTIHDRHVRLGEVIGRAEFPHLRELSLNYGELIEAELGALERMPALRRLALTEYGNARFGRNAAEQLVRAAPRLEGLSLWLDVTEPGLQVLTHAPSAARLRELDLQLGQLDARAVEDFLAGADWRRLEALTLSPGEDAAAKVAALADTPLDSMARLVVAAATEDCTALDEGWLVVPAATDSTRAWERRLEPDGSPTPRAPRSRALPPTRPTLPDAALSPNRGEPPRPYSPHERYETQRQLHHPKFGVGWVMDVSEKKIVVQFADDEWVTLVHGRAK